MSQKPPSIPPSEKSPPPVDPNSDGTAEDTDEQSHDLLLFRYVPSWLTSFVLHVSVIVLLALVPILTQKKETVNLVAGDVGPPIETPGEMDMSPLENLDQPLEEPTAVEVTNPELQPSDPTTEIEPVSDDIKLSELMPSAMGLQPSSGAADLSAAASGGNEYAGRSEKGGKKFGMPGEANEATQGAVELGLKWLAAHQLPDGSWNFNHQIGPGDRSSPHPGIRDGCPIAATAMCLMAFLGNGQTHKEGVYKEPVSKALNFLIRNQRRVNEFSGSLLEADDPQASMYSHGMATIALCEAYAMTKDTGLHDPAQAAVNFIAFAQDPTGGGWRYGVKQTGDLSVTGWHLMALKSGLMGDLEISKTTTRKAIKFLDAVSFDSGASYCYRAGNQDSTPNMTAVGLLCRMYMGWKHDHPALKRGIKYLAKRGPEIDDSVNMYYNYYAAQVLHQYGGKEWLEWDGAMREFLTKSQSKEGATQGSWYFKGGSDSGPENGGRIYCTAMAVMTLEVYYRYLPLYREAAVKEEFPLD